MSLSKEGIRKMVATRKYNSKLESRDGQFNIWKISTISGSKQSQPVAKTSNQKYPIHLNDAEELFDEIMFKASQAPRKRRKVQLSLKQTRILTTLLPNAIINIPDFSQDCADNFCGVLLFADVSGFTALCEKYKGFGKSGSDKLTVTLNNYLGAMVEVIYKHGGDVLKFSGDALLALWKLNTHEYMYSLIHRVVHCALYIQRTFGVYETDVKVFLKVKLAISAGNMTFTVIGNDNCRHYLVAGSPVMEVKAAEKVCTSGEVVLSLSAWGHLSAVNYEYYWKGSEHVQIIRIIYNPENTKREVLHSGSKDTFYKSEFFLHSRFQKELQKKKAGITLSSGEARTIVEEVSKKELNSELKTFLIPSVIQQIDADLPMEYLSEMRNITVMFVNIVPNKLNTSRLINMVNQAYILVCSLAYTAMGSVNKVSLFDKDVMILIIFGLRGFNHEGEVAGCLKCAYDIKQTCCTLEGVLTVSVGVTSGEAYCGVVGHPLRREYTVMGPVVNKAARIMCAYPGKVTCDSNTFMSSNLAASFFTLQEKRYLKGIEDTGPIYEFTQEKSTNTLAAMHDGTYPILGRVEEIHIFRETLRCVNNPNLSDKAILVIGQGRIGKTRLLDEMILEAHGKGIDPIVVTLHTVHSTLGYGTAQSIIKQILEIPDSASITEKERKLSMVLKNYISQSDYWYLNEVMNVRFAQAADAFYSMDPAGRFEHIKKIFHTILSQGTQSPILAIDDIDCCDELSWRLLLTVIDKRIKFLVMTMPKRLKPNTAKFLKFPPEIDDYIIKMTLSGLPDSFLASLACQVLNAKAVPEEVERVLIEKSNGNPGWCESFLLSLCQSNAIKVEELPKWHIRSLGLKMPPEMHLKRKHYNVVPDSMPGTLGNEKMIVHDEVPPRELDEKRTFSEAPKRKTTAKAKLVRFFGGERNLNLDHLNRISIVSCPEEAYEELKQTIQQVRSKLKLTSSGSYDISHVKEHDTLSQKDLMDDLERIGAAISKYDVAQDIRSSETQLRVSSVRKFNMNSGTESNYSIDTFSTDSLKQLVSDIHQRYRGRSSTVGMGTEDKDILAEPKLQSLLDVREDTKSTMRRSRSAGRLGRFKSISISDDIPRDDEFVDDFLEFSPCVLWRSYIDFRLRESIRIFLKNKTKNESRKSFQQAVLDDDHLSTRSSFSNLSGVSTKSRRGKDSRASYNMRSNGTITIGRGSKKFLGLPANPVREKTSEDIRTEQATTEDGKGGLNRNNRASVLAKKKNSFGISKGSRNDSYSAGNKLQEKNLRWTKRLSDWAEKQSDLPLSESQLELSKEDGNDVIPAILVNPNVKLHEVKTPESYIGAIMSVFDTLKPYEQLMLKCGSIIGEKFTRKMLNAIMHDPNQLLLAEAVKRLFDMRILCCASEPTDLDTDREGQCFCRLSDSDVIDDTMPRYSFCTIFLFRYAMFRSTLYELIPIEQKREFHIRAVKFLEDNNIICPTCERFRSQKKQFPMSIPGPNPNEEFQILPSGTLLKQESSTATEDERKEIEGKKGRKNIKRELFTLVLLSWLPNFQKCTCLALQADKLAQLIDHCIAAGLKEKEIDFILNYSFVMINLGHFTEARKLLADVETRVKSSVTNPFTSKKQKKACLGRVHLLLGNLYLELNELKKASAHLKSALQFIGLGFRPIYSLGSVGYWIPYSTQLFYQKYISPASISKPSGPQNYKATCLTLTCNIYMLQGKWKLAKLISLKTLNFLWRNNTNLIDLCNAFSNAIDVYRHSGDFKFCQRLEMAAAKSCLKEFNLTTSLEVIAFGRLTCSILNARLVSGDLMGASNLGDSAVKLSQNISSQEIESYTISKVTLNMMFIGKLNKAAGWILLLPVHDIWHHILSLEFILQTGFVVENSNVCLNAILDFLNGLRELDTNTYRRALSAAYVWLARLQEYELAQLLRVKLPQTYHIPSPGDTIDSMITVMNILEGDLLLLRYYPGEESMKNNMIRKLTPFVRALRVSTKKTALILPRFLHLHAYNQYRIGNKTQALNILDQAENISKKQGNTLERMWISHSRKVWTNTNEFDPDFWITSVKTGKLMKWTESRSLLSWKNYMYSLK